MDTHVFVARLLLLLLSMGWVCVRVGLPGGVVLYSLTL